MIPNAVMIPNYDIDIDDIHWWWYYWYYIFYDIIYYYYVLQWYQCNDIAMPDYYSVIPAVLIFYKYSCQY